MCDFYYTVNFTICDIHQSSTPGELYVLLGRPFLAMSNARMDCNTDWMSISFGSVKLRLNMFEDDTLMEYVDNDDSDLSTEELQLSELHARVSDDK